MTAGGIAAVGPGAWAWRPVYRLSRKGAEIVASELNTTVAALSYWGKGDDRDHRTTQTGMMFLEHALKINDVRIAIKQGAAARGYRVEHWLDDSQLKSQEMRDYVTLTSEYGKTLNVAVIPDAYFSLYMGDRRAHFFLELDRATMSNPRWRTRILAYLAYVNAGKYQVRYQTRSLRILTVTTTAERLENLRKTTLKSGGGDLFWFTTLDQVSEATILSSPIWRLATDERDSARKTLIS